MDGEYAWRKIFSQALGLMVPRAQRRVLGMILQI